MPATPPSYPADWETLWNTLNAYIDTSVAAGGGGSGSVSATSRIHTAETGYPGDVGPELTDTGLWTPQTRLRGARGTVISRVNAPTDLTSGSSNVAAETSPDVPAGAVKVTATGTVGTSRRLPKKDLAAPVDISALTVGIRTKVTTTDKAHLYRCRLEVSSDSFAGTDGSSIPGANRSYVTIIPQNANYQIYDIWQPFTVGSGDWVSVGTGANLASVNSWRIHLENDLTGTTSTISYSELETIPQAAKAKCVLAGDDYYISDTDNQWDVFAAKLLAKGFPGTLYANIGMFQSEDVDRLRHLVSRGWQVASHAFTNASHVDPATLNPSDPEGEFIKILLQAKDRQRQLGIPGGQDWAWWGGLPHTIVNHDVVRQYFRTGRLFISNPTTTETLPIANPYRLRAWGMSGTDSTNSGSNMIAYINKAIASKGLAVIVWHNSFGAELDAVLDHLDSNRATIDVVTMEDAVSPYLVGV